MEMIERFKQLLIIISNTERRLVCLIGGLFSLAIFILVITLSFPILKPIAGFLYRNVFCVFSWPSCFLAEILTGGGDNTSYAMVYVVLFITHFVVGCAIGFLVSVISCRIVNSHYVMGLITKHYHAVLAVMYTAVGVFCLIKLLYFISDMVYGRKEFNTPTPFVFSGFIALFLGLWLTGRFLSGWKKHIVRAVIFAMCLAPLPCGPEGTLMPAVVGIAYPPLFMMFPQGVLLVFAAAICFSLGAASFGLWHKN